MEKPVGGEDRSNAAPSFLLPHHYPQEEHRLPRPRLLWILIPLALVVSIGLAARYRFSGDKKTGIRVPNNEPSR